MNHKGATAKECTKNLVLPSGLRVFVVHSHGKSYLRLMGQYSIGDAIRQFLAQSRIKGSIQALQVEDVWESVMGKTIARYTDSLKVIDRTLFITTNVAPLKQELVYQKEKIKLRVNEALGEKVIDEIVIK